MYNHDYYSNLFKISEDNATAFFKDKKHNLTTVEKIGLESILADFVEEYEDTVFGESYGNIKDYTRYNEDSVDLLDGYSDTYIFDHYAIGSIWTTNNGCICMDAVDLDDYEGDDMEAFEDSDLYDRPNNFDIWTDFKPVLFRLN